MMLADAALTGSHAHRNSRLGELTSAGKPSIERINGATWKLLLRANPTTIVVHVTLDGRTPLCSICCSASRAPYAHQTLPSADVNDCSLGTAKSHAPAAQKCFFLD